MNEVIDRILASDSVIQDKCYKDGYSAGQEWVKDPEFEVTARELRNISRNKDELGRNWNYYFACDSDFTPGERLYFMIEPRHNEDCEKAKFFWECIRGDDETDSREAAFVNGFAEGALDIWDQCLSAKANR